MLCDQVISKIGAAVLRLVVVAVVMVTMSAQHTSAAPLTITVETFDATGPGSPVVLTPAAQLLPDGSFNFDGQHTNADWSTSWHFNADPDPHFTTWDSKTYDFQGVGVFQTVIDNQLVELKNTTAVPTSYMVNIDVPGGSLSPAHIVRAGVAAAVSGGQLSQHQNGHPLMRVTTDGSPHTSFFDVTYQIDDTTFLVDETLPQLDQKPIRDGFAIQLSFSLTPGATAHLLPQFEALPVPEPATGLLLITSLATMLVVRRR